MLAMIPDLLVTARSTGAPVEDDPVADASASAVRALAGIDVASLGPPGLETAMGYVRTIQRAAEGLLLRLTQRATELAAAGSGPGPGELLAGSGAVSAATSRNEAARAEAASALSPFGDALAAGVIGSGHLDAVASAYRRATENEREAVRGAAEDLARAAGRLSVDSFQRHMNRAMQRIRHQLGASSEPVESELRLWRARDGTGRVAGRLNPEDYERLSAAVASEMHALCRKGDGSVPLDEHLAAEALVAIATQGPSAPYGRPAITILVDAATIANGPHPATVCETGGGSPVAWHTLNRCACDAVIRRVLVDERGVAIDVGYRYRTATDAQWAALRAMYTSCAWHGCDRPLDWCQAHHLIHWDPTDGHGPTDLANLIPLCNRHHRLAHEGGWSLVLGADRTLQLRQPDGTPWRTTRPDRLGTRHCPSPADTGR